ncbi:MAG: hypothetical protein R6U28_01905 [Cyclonatronaceae bacterium]
MKTNFNTIKYILLFLLIISAGSAALLTAKGPQTDGTQEVKHHTSWILSYGDADFISMEISELVHTLYTETRGDRNPEVLRPVILQLEVHLKRTHEPVHPVIADLLRDLSVEHPVNDIRLMAYSTMMTALEKEAGEDGSSIGFVSR